MPRLFVRIMLIIACLSLMGIPVLAATRVENVSSSTDVTSDGSYSVTLKVKLDVEDLEEDIYFPVPENAKNVELFKSNARTRRGDGTLDIRIPLKDTLDTILIEYSIMAGQVTESERKGYLEVDIPLLSQCSYDILAMDFSIALPDKVERDMVKFDSTTHGREIEKRVQFSIDGDTISGSLTGDLKDHTSLILHLTVPASMFPDARLHQWKVNFDDIAMYILSALALVYWLVFLRTLPPQRLRSATGPEGLTAGELGTALIGQGGDLTMMVLSWAQMGYILIHPDKHGRVMLHRRMEMGNERCRYEQKCFRLLFGKQTQVNGTGPHYARVFHKVAALPPENRGYYQRRSGSVKLFRLIVAAVGAVGGIALGLALAKQLWLQILLAVLLCPLGFGTSFLMQDFIRGLHLRSRVRLVLGLGLGLGWMVLGFIAGEPMVSGWLVGSQLLGGLAAGYGGMRTEAGRLAMSRVLGLRRYLKTVTKPDLQRTVRQQPEYFFQMAPAAAALGVDAAFANRFGDKKLPGCPYLTTGMDGHMTAREWDRLLRQTVAALDRHALRLPIDRLMGRQ